MKVKTLLKEIQKRMEEYPDFEEWEVYTEQPDLCVPENFRTIEEEIQVQKEDSEKYGLPFNQEWIDYLKESEEKIENADIIIGAKRLIKNQVGNLFIHH